eukprot:TRINITY_DN5341_c0_g1_i1.p1 TRINITY_DN5341_c0_g1~~TRINITY_DN5341_c0_g1_i1.p1  ORF type:complete len:737 (+),score=198.36 TRINITY_DN5341_c0_g1_i1:2740-4950(+)
MLKVGKSLSSVLTRTTLTRAARANFTVYNGEKVFDKILIANRGEIACRVMNTCKKMGIKTVAVYSTPDANSKFVSLADEAVHVGPAASKDSYLRADKIIDACKRTGAQAVHPGYGFLSENHVFVDQLEKQGVIFIGPKPKSMWSMGDKIESKKIAKAANVNVIPGYLGLVNNEQDVLRIAHEIGYPVMIKASAGGGGKGMRVAYNDEECKSGYRLSKAEAMSSFASDTMFVEKFIENPRHIEIQVLGDSYGNYIYLNERECSIQRRNQKVLEEAPSCFSTPESRKAMGEQAISLARAVGYESAGTVEMLVDGKSRNFYFLEMNTRLQVEHPITELTTGVDLVEQMIRVAAGHKLTLKQSDVSPPKGWAIEARVYAEDPLNNFLPSIGRLTRYIEPTNLGAHVRCDSGVREGADISIYYDPMISKTCTWGRTRDEALERMRDVLDNYVIQGVTHNTNFLRSVITHPRFMSGKITTKFIPEEFPNGYKGQILTSEDKHTLIGAALGVHAELISTRASIKPKSESFNEAAFLEQRIKSLVVTLGQEQFKVEVTKALNGEIAFSVQQMGNKIKRVKAKKGEKATAAVADTKWVDNKIFNYTTNCNFKRGDIVFDSVMDGKKSILQAVVAQDNKSTYTIQFLGTKFDVEVRTPIENELASYMPAKAVVDHGKAICSPMPGCIFQVNVKVGDKVLPGQEVVIVEAMKMQNALRAVKEGKVKSVKVKKGQTVQQDDVLIEFDV